MQSIESIRRLPIAALALAVALFAAAPVAGAGEADVVAVKVSRSSTGAYDFDVTVRSNDKGWDYYADALEVLTPDGKTLLMRRVLLHPHEDEQPFTRGVHGVTVRAGLGKVMVRARIKPKGYDGATMIVDLPR